MKSFYRQQKTHAAAAAAATTKPTGGVSKKAAAHHHKKAALATNVHPAPGTDPGPNPPLIAVRFRGSTGGSTDWFDFDSSLVTADHGAGSRQQEEAEAEQRERAGREFDMDTRYGPCLDVTRAQRWRRADEQPCLWEGRV
jgi:DNA polymerase delta subunit 4